MKKVVAIGALLGALVAGCSKEPKTYEDCLLAYSATATSDKGAMAAAIACSRKFPQANPFDRFDGDHLKPSGR